VGLTPEQREAILAKHGIARRERFGEGPPQPNDTDLRREFAGKDLAHRERQVLELVAEGLNNKEIAGRLFIAEETVKHYMRTLLAKLAARNRTHAVALAYQRGLLTPPTPV
jgi:DNA-binding NarL/FixJ family response regulator